MNISTTILGPDYLPRRMNCLIFAVLCLTPVTASGDERILKALRDRDQEPDRWLARLELFSPYPANWVLLLLGSPHASVVTHVLDHLDIAQVDDCQRRKIVELLNSSEDMDVRLSALRKLATSPESHTDVREAIMRILTRPNSNHELVSASLQIIAQTG